MTSEPRPPLPPFDAETAAQKVRLAEDGWNSRDPERVSLAWQPASGAIAPAYRRQGSNNRHLRNV